MTITQFPTPPSRNNEPDVFVSRADAFLGAFPTFVDEVNPEIVNINAKAEQVSQDTETVVEAKAAAVAASHFKGAWSDLTGALEIPASVSHSGAIWLLLETVVDVTAETPGISDAWLKLDFVPEARTLTAGTGLTGGGDLSENRSFNVDVASAAELRAGAAGKILDAASVNAAANFITPSGSSNWTPSWGGFITADWVLTGNRTQSNPTGVAPGTSRTVWYRGNTATLRTVTFGSNYTGLGGEPPEVIVSDAVGFFAVLTANPAGNIFVSGTEYDL